MKWFTSDTHFGHKNIIRFCDRPYDSVEEMDESLITNWNERVKPGDEVYHMGDFAFARPERTKQILRRLNGQIFLILGNHDKGIQENKDMFGWIRNYHEIKCKGNPRKVVLSHYSMRVWNASHHGSWMLFGHSHGDLPDHGRSTDVGVDSWEYAPVSWDELKKYMENKDESSLRKEGNDFNHHGRKKL